MNTATSKKDFFYLVILILTFVTVIIGATYAVYALIYSHREGSSRVYTGTFSVEYLSGDIIDCNLLVPMEKVDLNDETNIYKNNFRVTNTGTLDGDFSLILEINENEFSNETLMYSIYDDNGLVTEDYIEGKEEFILAKKLSLEKKTGKDYILVIWIKESGMNQNIEMKKSLLGQIRVDASQKVNN